jgi:uncharacterized membrane protein
MSEPPDTLTLVSGSDPRGARPREPGQGPPLRHRLRRMLIAGLLILVPAALTIYVLVALFRLMDGFFGPLVNRAIQVFFPEARVPGLGLVMTLLVVLLLGWLSNKVMGRRLIAGFEQLIARVPVVRTIYSATKGVLEAVSRDRADAFTRVVMIEYPKENLFALGFVTRGARWDAVDPRAKDLLLVFVPTTPNPTSGFLLLVPRTEAITLPISVEEGIRMVISGGILLPEIPELHGRPVAPAVPEAGGARPDADGARAEVRADTSPDRPDLSERPDRTDQSIEPETVAR